MTSVFVSYSRNDLTFVDSLTHELERHLQGRDVALWVDYRNIPPGESWQAHIDAAVRQADFFLLVVSKDWLEKPHPTEKDKTVRITKVKTAETDDYAVYRPFTSADREAVQREWRLAQQNPNCRIILLTLDACTPPELRGCEWIDFRGSFRGALGQLVARLHTPEPVRQSPPPTCGFRMPPTPRLFWALSQLWTLLLAAWAIMLLALSANAGAVLIPALGVPALASAEWFRRRGYRFKWMQRALWFNLAVPAAAVAAIALVFPHQAVPESTSDVMTVLLIADIVALWAISLVQLWLLGSSGLYRWARPGGAVTE